MAKIKKIRRFAPFIANVKKLRGQRGWNQEDLAHYSGISISAVKQIESGGHSPTLETLIAFAGALGCRPWELLNDGTAPTVPPSELTFSAAAKLLLSYEKASNDIRGAVDKALSRISLD